ncbi:VOC family protein [Acidaminobacter sp. JC074]|uniref:VOC family protein n=1 Tax=Acidaminobacter sp. JC074 TaxID=2530199 RepID=UPI001F101261|nr:VOC family protein [Acidaminobacter sp. JC074]MCH4886824.1 VOC family protein [Acidaminobacter sp. JC074]
MKRILLQGYVKDSVKAVDMYKKAFDAQIVSEYMEEGVYFHVELDIEGTIVSLSENHDANIGDNMQFCLHYHEDEKNKISKAYEVLKEGATIYHDLGPVSYSELMVDFIDAFGIRWCLFV